MFVCVVSCAPAVCAVMSACLRACVCIYVGEGGYSFLIVFNEGPMQRIHNNAINPQQRQQHGCNLYGNAASVVAPSYAVDISDNGQHGCAAAS